MNNTTSTNTDVNLQFTIKNEKVDTGAARERFFFVIDIINKVVTLINSVLSSLFAIPYFKTLKEHMLKIYPIIMLLNVICGVIAAFKDVIGFLNKTTQFELYKRNILSELEPFAVTQDTIINNQFLLDALPKILQVYKLIQVDKAKGSLETKNWDYVSKNNIFQDYHNDYIFECFDKKDEQDMQNNMIYLIVQNSDITIKAVKYGSAKKVLRALCKTILSELNHSMIDLDFKSGRYNYFNIPSMSFLKIEAEEYYNIFIYEELKKDISLFFERNNKRPIGKKQTLGILIYGEPGTGKTTALMKYIIELTECLKIRIDKSNIAVTRNYLEQIEAPKVLIVDDLDVNTLKSKSKEANEFLELIDSKVYDVIVGITNTKDLPNFVYRTGRFDIKLEAKLPDFNDRYDILKNLFLNDREYAGLILKRSIRKIARKSEDFSHSDLRAIKVHMDIKEWSIEKAFNEVKLQKESYSLANTGQDVITDKRNEDTNVCCKEAVRTTPPAWPC